MIEPKEGFDRAEKVMAERGVRPIYYAIKGSVVYDLPGSHRDIDVRAVYLQPTVQTLALRKPRELIEVMDLPLDFVGWEAEKFMRHLVSHNGNFIEMLLTPEPFVRYGTEGHALREIGKRLVTKELYRYYRGYAYGQFKRAQSQIRTGKGAIYTYREMYAGIWLMRTGELVFPWAELREKVEGSGVFVSKLIPEFDMDRDRLTDELLQAMRWEFEHLNVVLDEAVDASTLPETYDAYDALNNLLLLWRSQGWVAA